MMKVSSVYLSQILGGLGAVLKALASKSSINRWANGGTHGHTMYLFIILTLIEGGLVAELQWDDVVLDGQGGAVA